MQFDFCPYCMTPTTDAVCPRCHRPTFYTALDMHLPLGTVLQGAHDYQIGAVLGQGGFGVTYVAWDLVEGKRVAVKEFFPTHCSGRTHNFTISPYPSQERTFDKGKERFLLEARTLKQLSALRSVVKVYDFFHANGTVYFVMEFIEGMSLKQYMQEHGMFEVRNFLNLMQPLMTDVAAMHRMGVIHRDIAPDNIIMHDDGTLRLVDFGAARDFMSDKSMTVVVKKGFAPFEQYMHRGQTAATDVYALAATIYYCITGRVLPDATERVDNPNFMMPSALGAKLTASQEDALRRALAVYPADRTKTVDAFLTGLAAAPKKRVFHSEDSFCFAPTGNRQLDNVLKLGYMAMEDGALKEAEHYLNEALHIEPECAQAYLCLFMLSISAADVEEAKELYIAGDETKNRYWRRTKQFAQGRLKEEFDTWDELRRARMEAEARTIREAEQRRQLLLGADALIHNDYTKAQKIYEAVLRGDADCADAHLGCFLAAQKSTTIDAFFDGLCKRFTSAEPQIAEACGEDTDHIARMMQTMEIPGYFTREEIAALYTFERSFPSVLEQLQQQKKRFLQYLATDADFTALHEHADAEIRRSLDAGIERISAELNRKIAEAEKADAENTERIRAAYQEHVHRADAKTEKRNREIYAKLDAQYQAAVDAMVQARTVRQCQDAHDALLALKDYRDSAAQAQRCLAKIKEIELQQHLNMGLRALEWEQYRNAAAEFADILAENPSCAEAHIGRFLAAKQKKSAEAFLAGLREDYLRVSPETKEACAEAAAHIAEMAEAFAVPNYLQNADIRARYVFDRSYSSCSAAWNRQNIGYEAYLRTDAELKEVLTHADAQTRSRLQDGLDALKSDLAAKLSEAKAEDSANCTRIAAAYAEHIRKADGEVRQQHETILQRLEHQYVGAVQAMQKACSAGEWDAARLLFTELGSYRDSAALAEQCRGEMERIQMRERSLTAAHQALMQGRYKEAVNACDAVLAVFPDCGAAVLDRFLAIKRVPSLDAFFEKLSETYSSADGKQLDACPEETDEISGKISAFCEDGVFSPSEIRRLYDYDRSFISTLDGWQQQKTAMLAAITSDMQMTQLLQNADAETKKAMDAHISRCMERMDSHIAAAKAEDAENTLRIAENYRAHIAKTDADIAARKQEYLRRQEACYEQAVAAAKGAKTVEQLEDAAAQLSAMPGYRDCEAQLASCQMRIQALRKQQKIDEAYLLLTHNDYKKALAAFTAIVNEDAACGEAHLGRFLAAKQVKSVQDYLNMLEAAFTKVHPQSVEGCPEDTDRINRAVERFAVADFGPEAVRRLYSFDRHYTSVLSEWCRQKEALQRAVSADADLAVLLRDAQQSARTLLAGIDGLRGRVDAEIANARQADEQARSKLCDAYRAHLDEADRLSQNRRQEILDRQEQSYQTAVRAMHAAATAEEYIHARDMLLAMEDYRDCRSLARVCQDSAEKLLEVRKHLHAGFADLESGCFDTALSAFQDVLKDYPDNSRAWLGRFLAFKRVKSMDAFFALPAEAFADIAEQRPEACPEDTAHIADAVQRFAVAGHYGEEEIRALYHYDRTYTSYVQAWKKYKKTLLRSLSEDSELKILESHADAETKLSIRCGIEHLTARLDSRIAQAEREDAANAARISRGYQSCLETADRQAASNARAVTTLLEKQYKAALQAMKRARSIQEYTDAQRMLENLKGFRDSADCAAQCSREINRLAEAQKHRELMQAQKLEAEREARRRKQEAELAAKEKKQQAEQAAREKKQQAEQAARQRKLEAQQAAQEKKEAAARLKAQKRAEVSSKRTSGKHGWIIGAAGVIAVSVLAVAFMLPKSDVVPERRMDKPEEPALHETTQSTEAVLSTEAALSAEDILYQQAQSLAAEGKKLEALGAYQNLGDYRDSKQQALTLRRELNQLACVAGADHILCIRKDGSVLASSNSGKKQCETEAWHDVIDVAAGTFSSYGVCEDGTVFYAGDLNSATQNWKDIVQISAAVDTVVGLKSDGTVVADGNNDYGQCDVSDWTNVVYISTGGNHTVGLRPNGTVVAVGRNDLGQCDVSDWTDIVAVRAGITHTVGLRSDGTLVAVGHDGFGQCRVQDWTDIVSFDAGYVHTVALKADGTLYITDYHQMVSGMQQRAGSKVFACAFNTVVLEDDGVARLVAIRTLRKGSPFGGYTWENIRTE